MGEIDAYFNYIVAALVQHDRHCDRGNLRRPRRRRARALYRGTGRYAVEHCWPLSQRPMALAGVVERQPGPDQKPAPNPPWRCASARPLGARDAPETAPVTTRARNRPAVAANSHDGA